MISIHALHEESDNGGMTDIHPNTISIHALHEESDNHVGGRRRASPISIHALHEESDNPSINTPSEPSDFNPRSP